MKRLLLLNLLLGFTSAVNAESHNYYLLLKYGYGTWTVPMESMEACEKALNRSMDKKNWVFGTLKISKKGAGKGICLSNK